MIGPRIMWLLVHGDLAELIEISLLSADMMLHTDQLDGLAILHGLWNIGCHEYDILYVFNLGQWLFMNNVRQFPQIRRSENTNYSDNSSIDKTSSRTANASRSEIGQPW